MGGRRALGIAIAVGCWLTSHVATADPPRGDDTQQAASPLPQVTIEAQREALRQRIAHFVTTVTTQTSSYESLARWHSKVCPGVTGLPQAQSEFIRKRISNIAQAAGAALGGSDCKPNLFVMVTSEPTRLAKEIWSRNPTKFKDLSGLAASPTELSRFTSDPHPVHVWYGGELEGAMGNALGKFSESGNTTRAPLVNRLPENSRIRWDDVQNIESVLIIVDVKRTVGLRIGALADYVAMLGLAEVNFAANYSADESILGLFDAAGATQPVSQLSKWDAAFLKALYASDQASKLQHTAIVNRMVSDPSVAPTAGNQTVPGP